MSMSAADEAGPPGSCPHCRALEARVAELERQLAEARREPPPFELKALRLIPHGWAEGWGLRPSPARRHWMSQAPHSYKWLPLVIANQWGWQILCPTDVRVTWDGSPDRLGVLVEVDPKYAPAIKSQFGSGIVTFSPPWLFRTPGGWDLYAKGPSNRWKENCVPLEGVIETWWLNSTFTLNWKLVEPGTVMFARGESLGQLVPVPHATPTSRSTFTISTSGRKRSRNTSSRCRFLQSPRVEAPSPLPRLDSAGGCGWCRAGSCRPKTPGCSVQQEPA
jgi:hypothetical protein